MDYIIVAQRYVPQESGRLWLEEVQAGRSEGYSSYQDALHAARVEQRASTDDELTLTVRRRLSLSLSAI